jgi:transposase
VHAAVGEDGFLAWEIFEHNVSHREVVSFIHNKLAPVLPRGAFVIIDNASNQKHPSVAEALESCTHGRYMYASPYSPELKPVERAFSMVRGWIRSHELEATSEREALLLIHREYAVDGPLRHHCYKLFDLYRVNNAIYERDLE